MICRNIRVPGASRAYHIPQRRRKLPYRNGRTHRRHFHLHTGIRNWDDMHKSRSLYTGRRSHIRGQRQSPQSIQPLPKAVLPSTFSFADLLPRPSDTIIIRQRFENSCNEIKKSLLLPGKRAK